MRERFITNIYCNVVLIVLKIVLFNFLISEIAGNFYARKRFIVRI